MRPEDSDRQLRALLRDAGLPAPEPAGRLRRMLGGSGAGGPLDERSALTAWEAFKRFAAMPVAGMSREDGSDGLLFQSGVYDWYDGEGPNFSFSIVRQFSFNDEDGEYDHMEQLECLLQYEPTHEFEALPRAEQWSFDMPLNDFFAAVERLESFQAVTRGGLTPKALRVSLEQV